MRNIKTLFDELKEHILIEFIYRSDRSFLHEQRNNIPKQLLFEQYGLFKDCNKLSYKILSKVKNLKENDEVKFNIKNCDFIKQIKVVMGQNNGAAFSPLDSKLDNNGFYNPLYIELDPNADDNVKLKCIAHELTHAYQNKHFLENTGYDLFDRGEKRKCFTNLLQDNDNLYECQQYIKHILYYLDDIERGAYIAELNSELQNVKTRFSSIKEVCDFVKNTIVMQNYSTIDDYINLICRITDERTQNAVITYVNNNSNLNFTTFQQIIKWLRNLQFKTRKKFRQIVPKMLYEKLKLSKFFANSNQGLLKSFNNKNIFWYDRK